MLQSLDEVNAKIDNYKKLEKKLKERSYQEDDLDDFMSNLTSEKLIDKTEIRKLRVSVTSAISNQPHVTNISIISMF